jgi:hypothetical protein
MSADALSTSAAQEAVSTDIITVAITTDTVTTGVTIYTGLGFPGLLGIIAIGRQR